MVNEREFKKYIKYSYKDKPKTRNYLVILALFGLIAVVFFSISAFNAHVPNFITPERIDTEAAAINAVEDIIEGFSSAGIVLDDIDASVEFS